MDDRPPAVRILRPTGDQGITPLEEVAIEARADDDYGIAQFELVYTVAGRRREDVPFTQRLGTDVARIGTQLLAAEDLGVQPGDVITYYARARDVGARQAVERDAQRHVLPRGEAVQRGVRAGAEPGDGRRAPGDPDRQR